MLCACAAVTVHMTHILLQCQQRLLGVHFGNQHADFVALYHGLDTIPLTIVHCDLRKRPFGQA